MINTFIAIAFVISLTGSIAAPTAAVLLKSYKEERRRIEAGYEPTYLNYTSQLHEPSQPKSPVVEESAKKPLGLPPAPQQGSPVSTPRLRSALTLSEVEGSTDYLPEFDRERILNESKGLMVIGDMGSAKTCVAQYIANGFSEHGIIVFDPHGKTDWGSAYVITKMSAIYEQMRILLTVLENGDESPLLIICDEWLEIRGDRRNKKGSEYAGLADDFIRLFSTKPRKFNKLATFVLHSPNVEAAGVDSFLRENYIKVHLGRIAKKEFPQIKDCAYPCALEGEQCLHPTHGHHTEFAPKDKAPRHLEPLFSAPIDIPLAYINGSEVQVCERGWDGQLRVNVKHIRERLELLYDGSTTEPMNQATEPLNQANGGSYSDSIDGSEPRFTPLNLTKQQVLALIENLNRELNQTQIIENLWQVKKGGTEAWKKAHAEFKQLTEE